MNFSKILPKKLAYPISFGHIKKSMSHYCAKEEEFQVPVPWGIIAGKRYGSSEGQQIIAIHGWQDNLGTFETLIPLLSNNLSIYSIDFAGHGLSSPMPAGMSDSIWDKVSTIERVANHFSFSNFSLLGHSMGGAVSYLYAATFPEKVKKLITLDSLFPKPNTIENTLKTNKGAIEAIIKLDNVNGNDAPSYTLEEAHQKLFDGHKGSITKESAEILLKRSVVQSIHDNRYSFGRDRKIRIPAFGYTASLETILYFGKQITCPILVILANPGAFHPPQDVIDHSVCELRKGQCPELILEWVEGTHHVHLNNPERVSPLINKFLENGKL